ncbi:MAG: ArsA-related P-loop ATPase [Pseudomonadota bacterium]
MKTGGRRLTLISGKGGVGKTTLASALALGSAARGEPTVLISLENTDDRHPVFGIPFGYEATPVPDAAGSLSLLRVEALPAVKEYVRRKLPFGRLYDGAFDSRAFRDFAAAAPGFEELMVLGKLYDLATTSGFRHLVFDAPASGHLRQLVNVPAAAMAAVRLGPLYDIARKIDRLLKTPTATAVVLPVLAEEMPLRETAELAEFVDERLGVPCEFVINRVLDAGLDDEQLARFEATVVTRDDRPLIATAVRELSLRGRAQRESLAQACREWPSAAARLDHAVRLPQITPPGDAMPNSVAAPNSVEANGLDWSFAINRAVAEAMIPMLEAVLDSLEAGVGGR